ncbi:heme biosynthesis HemY N-terminal domain-containing protein [Roseovarius sp. SK2]|jgi:HemY protein|uniref:heme biosynthesis protein HemY n=1 Tax=Roseovarius TaxID=74030 RepID=UPI000CDCEBB4|nr:MULTISPECIES: heme biosynthesis HemY N-terminal domain-containing protein [Roseovarius]MDD9725345.1 heme biosynthesis HemY N-terminal domain-containing protein [Roseovarius sp. SK2]
MLWSVIKIILFIGLVAAASWGAIYLLELDGGVRIVMAGQEFNLTPLMAVIVLVLLVVAVWLLLKLVSLLVAVLHFINGDDTALSRYFQRNRQEKGYQALSEGLMALASGEGELAMAKAGKAERYLNKPALTNLITAQAAEISGNRRKAEETYKRLLTNEKTRFVGVRGIMRQKLANGETETALKLAKTAFALKPKHEEVQDTLLKLQAQTGDWKGARETLSAKLKSGNLPRAVHRRRDAVLALSEARDVLEEGKSIEARESAIEANRLSPDLVPAAVLTARGYIEQGNKRNATRVIKKAWDAQPHPDLAAAFAEIEPEETPQARIKRFAKLLKIHPDHRETRLIDAELHLAAEDFPAARRALGDLAEVDPDARALTIMAAIERGEGASDSVVKGWLARALSAPRGPQWVCENCQHIHAQWAPSCDNCDAFDTLSWRAPPASSVSSSTGIEMLPLIIGSIEDHGADTPDESDDSDKITDAEVADAEIVEDTGPEKTEK